MSESCTSNCSSCQQDCASRKSPQDMIEPAHSMSSIKKVIGVVSGKGGVGKSLVTSMLAVLFNRRGYNTAVLDADVTGPSIPKIFGIHTGINTNEWGMLPAKSKTGIEVMSVNLLLENENAPVIWRGPVIAGAVKQFWTDVIWSDVDYMFVDMPPGTGDVPLTVFQSLPVDGIVIVTSPQELVSMIVSKAVNMAKMMNIPILGIVENMSYFQCPDCGKITSIFGESRIDSVAAENGTKVLGRLPINPELARLCDDGVLELFEGDWLNQGADEIEKTLPITK
ncbi:Mrp/NBP35 family ATP-binding protein [Acetanaerobacterium elongatum]|uniref:Iron-sulfur cluster carrier protein n=1 Tax=Acetanaerobacterium elongatum TaxID=258515 RepID=A0A1H0D1S5_9FIRM|nr:Mrp/NBP35 family ATP-binding protein [Acetanaerobacterium elongatum]SDN63791.1 Chromosome partitioning ATPase, Mrp family, contains Fe-S cluster [Acetanaerobacterium elongatum]